MAEILKSGVPHVRQRRNLRQTYHLRDLIPNKSEDRSPWLTEKECCLANGNFWKGWEIPWGSVRRTRRLEHS